jgi:hypothetical protein
MDADRRDGRGLWPSQWLGLLVGAVFVVVGVAGFFVTGFDDFAAHHTGEELLIFEVNPLHNVVHLALGALAFALCWTRRGALTYGLVVFAGYAAALVYGLFAVDETWDFLSLNPEDNWLHLALAALGAVIAAIAAAELQSDRGRARAQRTVPGRRRPTAPA